MEIDLATIEEMLGSIPGEGWSLVSEDGIVRYAAGPIGGVLGHGTREGTHIATWAHPDDLPAVLDAMQAVLGAPNTPVRVLTRARHDDGSWRVYEVTAVNRLADPAIGFVVVRTRELDQEGPGGRDDTSLIESLAEAVPTPILVVDHAGHVLFANDAARTLVGDELHEVVARLAEVEESATFEVGDRFVQARVARRSDGWVAMLDDITTQHWQAIRDHLTGAANRTAFEAQLRVLLAHPDGSTVSVVFVDLDGFKEVNDRHGHAEGDRVLRDVAERLRAEVRPADMVARIGGDEYAVLCEGLSADAAAGLAARLATSLDIGASAGAATSPPVAADAATLLAAADRAMYADKQAR